MDKEGDLEGRGAWRGSGGQGVLWGRERLVGREFGVMEKSW